MCECKVLVPSSGFSEVLLSFAWARNLDLEDFLLDVEGDALCLSIPSEVHEDISEFTLFDSELLRYLGASVLQVLWIFLDIWGLSTL